MKAVKYIAIVLAIALFAGFLSIMFLPVDTFLAEKKAKLAGYEIPEAYTDSLYRYYYNNLNADEQLAYRIVYASFFADPEDEFPDKVVIPRLSNEELQEMYVALSYDNPELYFLGNKCSMTSIGSVNYFVPQYLMVRSDYDASWVAAEAKINQILAGAPSGSDYDKELYIHDYLVQNCEYSESGSAMVYTMHGVLVDGSANCEGYSRTAQYLLRQLGIYNRLAIGEAEGGTGSAEGHMWNVVKIDGDFYNLDITWDDYAVAGSVDFPDNSPSHVYFNISTEDMKSTHVADDDAVWSQCKADSFGYFKKNNLIISTYNTSTENAISQALINAMSNGYNSIELVFTDKSVMDTSFNHLMNGGMYNIIVSANRFVSQANRLSPTTVQYAKDEDKLVLRYFFAK